MQTSAPYWVHALAIATAAVAVVVVVLLNFEGMRWLGQQYNRRRREKGGPLGRRRLLRLVFGLVALHALSMMMFGTGFWALLHLREAGSIDGTYGTSLFDAFYLSAMTYSTVGFGDLTPKGPIRWLAGAEALMGLMMVAWSSTFAFMEMARHWRDDRD